MKSVRRHGLARQSVGDVQSRSRMEKVEYDARLDGKGQRRTIPSVDAATRRTLIQRAESPKDNSPGQRRGLIVKRNSKACKGGTHKRGSTGSLSKASTPKTASCTRRKGSLRTNRSSD